MNVGGRVGKLIRASRAAKSIQSRTFSTTNGGGSRSWKKILGAGVVGASLVALVISNQESTAEPTYSRPKVVIVGSGWAGLQLARLVDTNLYDVIMVSPKNYFLYTPLLTEATTGAVELRSLIEPVRKYLTRHGPGVEFYEASCTGVNLADNTISCEDFSGVKGDRFILPYDKLIIAVGSVPNTLNTAGVTENCYFLKEPQDAIKIRDRIMDCLETAYHPSKPLEEIQKLVHFVVVGGGPTGVEFAGQLHDFVTKDLIKWFPKIVQHVKITIVQSGDHILNTFDSALQSYAEQKFSKDGINILLNSRVNEVKQDSITVFEKATKATKSIPFGLCVWAAGVGPNPLVTDMCKAIPEQNHNRALVTDEFLKVKGTSNVYAIGDCGTVSQKRLKANFEQLFKDADKDSSGDLTLDELKNLIASNISKYPQLVQYQKNIETLFKEGDTNKDNKLSLEEFQVLLETVDRNLKSLPATAQVASQQGTYLAKALYNEATQQQAVPFAYKHLGSFAYLGGQAAVADLGAYQGGGFLTWWLYRSAYWTKQLSWKNRVCLSFDWMKAMLFGRDISRV